MWRTPTVGLWVLVDVGIAPAFAAEPPMSKFKKRRSAKWWIMTYDYDAELRETERRVQWIRESIIGAEQHGCFDIAEALRERLKREEKDLRDLHSLR